jgi:hypothetical protein
VATIQIIGGISNMVFSQRVLQRLSVHQGASLNILNALKVTGERPEFDKPMKADVD